MPELPEVETIRLGIAARLAGRRVVAAWSTESPKFVDAAETVGATIGELRRRGKYLIADLDDDRELIVHLGMTGQLRVSSANEPDASHLRAKLTFGDGTELRYRDVRQFGRVHVVRTGDYARLATLANLGPEPFSDDFDPDAFTRTLRNSNRHIKTQLLSQRAVAGVGNIYADEALWLARINPATRKPTWAQGRRLHEAVREALGRGLAHGGTTLRDYVDADGAEGTNQHTLECYGRSEEPCHRCGTALRFRVLDARGTTWCPTCQRR